MMKDISYRNVRSTPPRVSKLSELENDIELTTRQEVRNSIEEMVVVTSLSGSTGAVTLDIPEEVQIDWEATDGRASILNKPTMKRTETFRGVTDANGNYSVTYSTPFASTPDVQPQLQAGTPSQVVRITSSTATGFTVNVTNRASATVLTLEVLSATATPVSGASVGVLVTAR